MRDLRFHVGFLLLKHGLALWIGGRSLSAPIHELPDVPDLHAGFFQTLNDAEILTHAAFYAGWPKAWAAFRMAKEVWAEDNAADAKAKRQNEMVFPIGAPNDAFAKYFIGQSYLAPLSTQQVGIYNVTFEPGCRNNWHIHHAKSGGGQILVCVAGTGYYQEWGKPAQELRPGDVVNIPVGVKHWHGAAPDSWFSHLAVEVPGDETSNEWLEAVDNTAYFKAAGKEA